MNEKYGYVIDNNGLLTSDEILKFNEMKHLERKIYLFVKTAEQGIAFPDLSDIMLINQYSPGEEHFTTKKELICHVNWDNSINYPNRTVNLNRESGIIIARTIMISKTKMDEILKTIQKTKDTDNIKINLKNY